jgi:hypothetical protein
MGYQKLDMGEMINVWIEHHGSLDLDTDEQTIINFYKNIKKEKNMIDIEKNMVDVEKVVKKIEEATSTKVEGFDNSRLIKAILEKFEIEVRLDQCEKDESSVNDVINSWKRRQRMSEGNA